MRGICMAISWKKEADWRMETYNHPLIYRSAIPVFFISLMNTGGVGDAGAIDCTEGSKCVFSSPNMVNSSGKAGP